MADNKGTVDKSTGASAAGMKVDTKLVRQLADMLAETGLTEIEVEDGDRKIRVARNIHPVTGGAPAPAPTVIAAPGATAAPADGTVQQILIENAQPVEYDQPLLVVG